MFPDGGDLAGQQHLGLWREVLRLIIIIFTIIIIGLIIFILIVLNWG